MKITWPSILRRICLQSDAATELGLQESRIRDLCRDKTLRAVRLGRVWIIDRESVKAEKLKRERE